MLHHQKVSLDHAALADYLGKTENLLIIQDLDGVCMPLVNDPLTRTISKPYLKAAARFDEHFFVLTNGEHIGQRGLQTIIESAVGGAAVARSQKLYLPGLAAGGVQWQDRSGQVSHPGVGQAELDFLTEVAERIERTLDDFLKAQHSFSDAERTQLVKASVLDNVASPTANLNSLYQTIVGDLDKASSEDISRFVQLQQHVVTLMEELLQEAEAAGLTDQFFVHYAPNLGRDGFVHEVVWFADAQMAGTTDFQFMLRGAVKEAGVLSLLNHYFFVHTGHYPLGVDFNARQAPRSLGDMLELVVQNFDFSLMPAIVGVGDTVTSQAVEQNSKLTFKRGGSDRNFLQLIQNIGQATNTPTLRVFVDSSGGELRNRRPLKLGTDDQGNPTVLDGIGDPKDERDPLAINVVFPGGPAEYCQMFETAADSRGQLAWGGSQQ
ncbi:glucosylglycerol 3-phosphatase [cf. Phormidesmis sp. LEGE 11477]|uniref:glucosylglycerol 3-phosphatase n=1 Tax=cf. Phormidesmis sp. LEGE 11477 TaxID=1828680 RepID=UPI00187FED3D|nr:glucosylglycerol 3-phosphatase [cf. Phormidesmis sp. LEGE 11477]MBE9060133.1 glucosylglycerol 3-phosphatase [cf. Phormidesmis sp. LEGE 11477]